jgi:hypothetical protein
MDANRKPSMSERVARSVAAVLLGTAALVTLVAQPSAAASTNLIGTFTITAGACSGGVASGTYLRMVLSGGSNASGPYFSNSDSSCSDNSYTPLSPGSAGGLVTGSYQSQPSPAFDASGNALANQITIPVAFEGVKFATSTNPTDPQSGLQVPVPSITATGTALSGNLESFGVSWNKQVFNQGSPKPDGSSPANTTPVTGSYDPGTGAYTLRWSSQVVGGPFNGFSALWNLTGRFIPTTASSGGPVGSTNSAASPGSSGQPTTGGPAQPAGPTQGSGGTLGPAGSGSTPTAGTSAGGLPGTSGRSGTGSGSPPSAGGGGAALSSHTTTSGGGGWQSPGWLVLLVVLLGVLGLVGVLWSERAIRHPRILDVRTEGD